MYYNPSKLNQFWLINSFKRRFNTSKTIVLIYATQLSSHERQAWKESISQGFNGIRAHDSGSWSFWVRIYPLKMNEYEWKWISETSYMKSNQNSGGWFKKQKNHLSLRSHWYVFDPTPPPPPPFSPRFHFNERASTSSCPHYRFWSLFSLFTLEHWNTLIRFEETLQQPSAHAWNRRACHVCGISRVSDFSKAFLFHTVFPVHADTIGLRFQTSPLCRGVVDVNDSVLDLFSVEIRPQCIETNTFSHLSVAVVYFCIIRDK